MLLFKIKDPFANIDAKVDLLYRNFNRSIVAILINGLIAVFFLWPTANKNTLIAWYCALCFLSFARLLANRKFHKNLILANPVKFIGLFVVGVLLSGILWGSLGILFLNPNSWQNMFFLTILVAGMSLGGLGTLSVLPGLAKLFILIALSPFAVQFFLLDDPVGQPISILIIMFMLFMSFIIKEISKTYEDIFNLIDQNNSLVQSLLSSKKKTEKLNKQLIKEIEEKLEAETALKEAKKELEEVNKDLKEAIKVKDQFIANVSHELRTPMNAIMGMTELLLETNLNKEQKNFLNIIYTSSESLLELINDLLTLSKINSSKIKLNKSSVDLKQLLQTLYSMFQYKANNKNVDLILEIKGLLPNYVSIDSLRLKQIILNLISNALKFTDSPGVVIVLIESNWDGRQDKASITFNIADNGIGISKEDQKKLFKPFSQAHANIAEKYGGTGLGLAISKKLVAAMGGNLKVKSIEKLGSRFFFTLNIDVSLKTQEVSNAHSIKKKKIVPLKKLNLKKILVAEDNPVNAHLISTILEKNNNTFEIVNTGKDAVNKFKNSPNDFSMILMDCQMPELDGYQATKQIRAIEKELGEKRSIPIIALTANAYEENQELCLESGMNDFLAKPFKKDDLISIINKYYE